MNVGFKLVCIIFIQLMSSSRQDMIDSLQLTTDPKNFFWVSQGVVKVDGMDDKEEFDLTDVGYKI